MTDMPEIKGLGDKSLLTIEQLRRLYTDPQNGFGSLVLEPDVRKLISGWENVIWRESEICQRLKIGQYRDDVLNLAKDRFRHIITELLNKHAIDKAPELETALKQMGLTNEALSQLPRNLQGHIDDTMAIGEASGVKLLVDKIYLPMLEEALLRKNKSVALGC